MNREMHRRFLKSLSTIPDTKVDIAKKIGVSRSSLYNYIGNRNDMNLVTFIIFCRTYRINPDWVLMEKGEMNDTR